LNSPRPKAALLPPAIAENAALELANRAPTVRLNADSSGELDVRFLVGREE